jgi:hypothetical protein
MPEMLKDFWQTFNSKYNEEDLYQIEDNPRLIFWTLYERNWPHGISSLMTLQRLQRMKARPNQPPVTLTP